MHGIASKTKPVSEAKGFLLGHFFRSTQRKMKSKTHLTEPQGKLENWLDAECAALEQSGLRRHLRTVMSAPTGTINLDGRDVVLLGSNNYLGLSLLLLKQRKLSVPGQVVPVSFRGITNSTPLWKPILRRQKEPKRRLFSVPAMLPIRALFQFLRVKAISS